MYYYGQECQQQVKPWFLPAVSNIYWLKPTITTTWNNLVQEGFWNVFSKTAVTCCAALICESLFRYILFSTNHSSGIFQQLSEDLST